MIKRPIDMQRLQQKMMSGQYDSVEDMVADFVQMFDNACKYNEPESVIYKVDVCDVWLCAPLCEFVSSHNLICVHV